MKSTNNLPATRAPLTRILISDENDKAYNLRCSKLKINLVKFYELLSHFGFSSVDCPYSLFSFYTKLLLVLHRLEEERNAAAETLKDESEQLRSEVSKSRSESENIAALLDKKTRK